MLKSTTNADCPYCMIQRSFLYLESTERAALIKVIKEIKPIVFHFSLLYQLLEYGILQHTEINNSSFLSSDTRIFNSAAPIDNSPIYRISLFLQ